MSLPCCVFCSIFLVIVDDVVTTMRVVAEPLKLFLHLLRCLFFFPKPSSSVGSALEM